MADRVLDKNLARLFLKFTQELLHVSVIRVKPNMVKLSNERC